MKLGFSTTQKLWGVPQDFTWFGATRADIAVFGTGKAFEPLALLKE
jgi:hypothetical protein